MEIKNENENWKVNHMWDDGDGNPTQWIFYKDNDDFPYYIDYIEAVNQFEVSHFDDGLRRLYVSKDFEDCIKFVERI